MNNPSNSQTTDKPFLTLIRELISLRKDTDHDGTITNIKSNAEFKSANAWALIFAIFIASIGLNVNSTATIIGAMLISPLMGPIVGAGFALGTHDYSFFRKCMKNLSIAVGISLLTSTLYFILSPISEVQSELLARTRPTFYDVLIAFLGGATGIIAISRKEKSNAIPGVAIATALMPPLCTAGFGLANLNWQYFLGALYLFVINAFFIGISTQLFVRYLKFQRAPIDVSRKALANKLIMYFGTFVTLPSIFFAWYLQQESSFKIKVSQFIANDVKSDRYWVVDSKSSYGLKNPKIEISLMGDPLSINEIESIKQKASQYHIKPESIIIRQSSFSQSMEKRLQEKIGSAEDKEQLVMQKKALLEIRNKQNDVELGKQLTKETFTLLPHQILSLLVSTSIEEPNSSKIQVIWRTSRPSKASKSKLLEFLQVRLNQENLDIQHLAPVVN